MTRALALALVVFTGLLGCRSDAGPEASSPASAGPPRGGAPEAEAGGEQVADLTDAQLRARVEQAIAGWDIPRAQGLYRELRARLGKDDPGLLAKLAWRYMQAAVTRGKDWTPRERTEALYALGRIGTDEALRLLSMVLSESEWDVRWMALEAAAQADSPMSTELLVRGLRDTDRRVRCAAGGLLLERGDLRGVKAALECGPPEQLKYRATRLLVKYAERIPEQVITKVAHHQAQDPRVMLAVVLALRARPKERYVLEQLYEDPKPMVKRAARCALAVMDHARKDPAKALVPFDRLILGDQEARLTGMFLLGMMGRRIERPALQLLERISRMDDPWLVGQACVAVAHMEAEEGLPILEKVLERDLPVAVKRKAVMAMGRIHAARGVQILRDLIRDPDTNPALSAIALSSLVALEATSAVGDMAALLSHREPMVRIAAASSLAELAAKAKERVVPALEGMLSSPIPAVRSYAARGLGLAREHHALPGVAALMSDPDRAVQYNAAAAVISILGLGPTDQR